MRDDKIVVVKIVLSNYTNMIQFFDKVGFEKGFWIKTYKPSYKSYDLLRRVIKEMDMIVDLDLNSGIITCTRRNYEKENSAIHKHN